MRRAKQADPPRKSPSITHLVVRGFKSIRDRTELELRPLTLLCGRNSSGKSSFMQPFLLMKQTLEAPVDPGPLLLHGPNVKFTAVEQLLWNGSSRGSQAESFEVGLGGIDFTHRPVHGSPERISVTYRGSSGAGGVGIERLDFWHGDWEWHRGMLREEMSARSLRALNAQAQLLIPYDRARSISLEVHRDRCFLGVHPIGSGGFVWGTSVPPYFLGSHAYQFLRALLHIPGLRGNPERAYLSIPVGKELAGEFHHYTASIIARWQDTQDLRLRRLGEYLARLELSSKAEARRMDATRVEVRVGRLPKAAGTKSSDLVNIADVGIGVSQVLPLLVALLTAEPGQLVYVEQPEIHLHPSAEVALAEILLEAARRGVLIVAETHSLRLIKGIQTAVATDAALAPLVKLHWFSRGADGASRVASADLDEDGAFGDWPEDLADVDLAIEDRYLRAAMAKGAE